MRSRAVGLLLGYAADRALGDPRRLHPVAGFGVVAGTVERALYADSRLRGVVHVTVLVGATAVLGAAAERAATRPLAHTLLTAGATWVVLGGRSLEVAAAAVHHDVISDDLPSARRQLTHLVGRDTSALDAFEISRAVVESVAENTSDAVVAPLVWGAFAGVPGLLGYRAANTLDAMVGHHNDRYERYGWASARFDDLVNLPGSRVAGALVLAARPSTAASAWRAWRRDAVEHPSPNAGVVEAAFAGALGIHLGGTNRYYGHRIEHRTIMGDGRHPGAGDVLACIGLARRVDLLAAAVSGGAAALLPRGRDRRPTGRIRHGTNRLRSAQRSRGSRWKSGTVALL